MPSYSINKTSNSPYYMVSFIGTDGGQKRRSTKVPHAGGMFEGETLSAAQASRRALIVAARIVDKEAMDSGRSGNVSVRKYLDAFATRRKPYISAASHREMIKSFAYFCEFLGRRADGSLSSIVKDDAKRFVEHRRREVRHNTVRRDVSSLGYAFRDAYDSEIIDRNPFSGLKIPGDTRAEKVTRAAFEINELQYIIDKFPPEWSSAVRCSFETYGQRLGDILALRWEQFDFAAGVVHMTTGKTGAVLDQPMRAEFAAWARAEMERRQAKPKDLLHPTLHRLGKSASGQFGALLRAHGIGVVNAKTGGKRCNINSKTFHSIRATVVTLLQAGGVVPGMSQALLGHESQEIHNHYNRASVEQRRGAAQVLPTLGGVQ